jgi:CBS domain-containing protein
LESTLHLHEAFQIIIEKKILSAPVYDIINKEYTGFLDVRDLVSFVVYVYEHNKNFFNFKELLKQGLDLFLGTEEDGVTLTYLSRRNKFVKVSADQNLYDVAILLSDSSIHRVPVVDNNGKVINIISQSNINQLLALQLQNEAVNRSGPSIDSINIGTHKNIITIHQNAAVIDAFRILDKKKISGIALIDDTGRMVGVTTGKDLGLFLEYADIKLLEQPIGTYLKYIRTRSQNILEVPAVAVFGKSKLVYAIGLIASTKIHRLFICDSEEAYRPVGVISITEILRYLVS